MDDLIFCLDSGTTTVKAAAFDTRGRLIAVAQRANGALRRDGLKVEQDMLVSLDDALAVLKDCVSQTQGTAIGLVVTGQGDGLWPVDRHGEPVGRAMTWLDGRSASLVSELNERCVLTGVEQLTSVRPTAAAQSVQLLWLQRNQPERYNQIAHVMRIKEWLFLCLTGEVRAEPTSLLHTWGSWRSGALVPEIDQVLGLKRGTSLVPEMQPIGECVATLSNDLATDLGLPVGLPVLMGPGDVQASMIGLGLGLRDEVARCSVFGTSAIHASLVDDPAEIRNKPSGALIQPFAIGGYFCSYPSFNGTTLFEHVARLTGRPDLARGSKPSFSSLVVHPFFEPGGERSPYTTPHAKGAMVGLTSATTHEQVAWAAREALVFVARKSHDMMSEGAGDIALGGGLAADTAFAAFMATATVRAVHRTTTGHASLKGVGALGAMHLLGASRQSLDDDWIGRADDVAVPETGAVAEYAARKYELFLTLVGAIEPQWAELSALAELSAQQTKDNA
ncbi:FGGY family carbohydrate kinase [Neorhizobium sp. IRS_2294]|uniref:FGGY family carbohydrate kinase n=1 Tax=unclassified Neorhizobium TaxID=2629175 RepID=UPI003D2B4FD4